MKGKLIEQMDNQTGTTNLNIHQYAQGVYTIRVMPEGVTYQIVKR